MLDTMKGLKRTHQCGEGEGIGSTVTGAGFVQRVRDKGSLMFEMCIRDSISFTLI